MIFLGRDKLEKCATICLYHFAGNMRYTLHRDKNILCL